ncbi:fluoride efflux transporter family protein [Corynebacterium sp. HMSC29G08]|uniref:fluoride efflux transporter family protein n=1 Tax=Corynebacterium sp. HMSC29G08 TaxID=1581069 RepID=UPI0008A13DE8|nr:fluoride efflux transporter family protein [Corynebacterium sp. HMSC29G08]OFT81074.1 hypothetical protein HMPREF3101_11130 [Corynebacterium sp. HMSC29G08]
MQTNQLSAGLLVGLGAAFGASTRHLVTLYTGHGDTTAIIAMLVVNMLGCLAMGYFKPGAFWGTGFLGGFTSYSIVAATALEFTMLGALIYMVITFSACIASWLAGDAMRRRRG